MILKQNKNLYNLLIICFFVLLLTLPFMNKAVHIDDIAFLYIAKQIIKDPLHPYSFNLEWSSETGLAIHITDPPLMPYYIAIILLLFGEIEWVLHLSFIIFPLIAGISMYYLSKKFTTKPLYPTLFLITSIVFVVMSHNFMVDVPFLAFFLLSIVLYIYGVDLNKNYLMIIGVLFCGLAYLVKYSGIIVIPVLAVYALSKKKLKPISYLIIPIIIIGLWNLYTFKIYGIPHNIQILGWLLESQSSFTPQSIIIRLITNFTYIGGATLFPLILLYPFIIDNKNKIAYALIAIIASILSVILYFVSESFTFRYTVLQLILFAFFLSMGLFFLFVIVRYYCHFFLKLFKFKNIFNEQYTNNIFLFSWFLIVFLFNSTFAGGAARYVTAVLPPMLISYFKIIDKHKFFNTKSLKNFIFISVILTSMLGAVVAYADYEFANTYRDFSEIVSQYKNDDNKIWFAGHLGFQYYMEDKGYTVLGLDDNSPKKGDIVIKAQLPSPRKFSPELKERLMLLYTKSYKGKLPLKLQNSKAHAGFYTYGGGFLPYSFSHSNLEDFDIYVVVK